MVFPALDNHLIYEINNMAAGREFQGTKSREISPHVRESRRVLDSGFHTVDSGFRVLDSGFQLSGFRIPKRAGFQSFLCVF